MTRRDTCPRCDRARWMAEGPSPNCYCVADHLGVGCTGYSVDWRDRALGAEALAKGLQSSLDAERDTLFAEKFGTTPRLYYSQRLYLRESEDIARRALVEGLAEAVRLRATPCATCAAIAADEHQMLAEVRAGAARAERERIAKFVRAGDQDPGGMRVAGWSRWSNHTGMRIAGAIDRGEHTPRAEYVIERSEPVVGPGVRIVDDNEHAKGGMP